MCGPQGLWCQCTRGKVPEHCVRGAWAVGLRTSRGPGTCGSVGEVTRSRPRAAGPRHTLSFLVETQACLSGCQHQADTLLALPGLCEPWREPVSGRAGAKGGGQQGMVRGQSPTDTCWPPPQEDGAVAAEAHHAAHPPAAAGECGSPLPATPPRPSLPSPASF